MVLVLDHGGRQGMRLTRLRSHGFGVSGFGFCDFAATAVVILVEARNEISLVAGLS